jgi:hypothetical protein
LSSGIGKSYQLPKQAFTDRRRDSSQGWVSPCLFLLPKSGYLVMVVQMLRRPMPFPGPTISRKLQVSVEDGGDGHFSGGEYFPVLCHLVLIPGVSMLPIARFRFQKNIYADSSWYFSRLAARAGVFSKNLLQRPAWSVTEYDEHYAFEKDEG